MKKVLFTAAILFLAVGAVEAKPAKKSKKSSFKNIEDSVSYAIGLHFGESIRQFSELEPNTKLITKGLDDAIADKTSMTMEEAMEVVRHYFEDVMPAQAKEKADKEFADIRKKNKDLIETESGLLYKIIEPGDSDNTPTEDSEVTVHYHATLTSGEVFDSSVERDEPATFPLSNVIEGFREAVMLIGQGGKIKVWIPYQLGYGEGNTGQIPPYSTLIFEIELLEVGGHHPEFKVYEYEGDGFIDIEEED